MISEISPAEIGIPGMSSFLSKAEFEFRINTKRLKFPVISEY